MPIPRLPEISSLPNLPTTEKTRVLDLLFEPHPTIHALLLPLLQPSSSSATCPSYAAFIDQAFAVFSSLASDGDRDGRAELHQILGSHPRLGERKLDSAQSAAEQAQLRSAAEQLAALNAEYEARFPGLRYVVFVDGREKSVVMADMRRRIARGDIRLEEREGIQAMCDIAKDRASKLQR